MKKGRNSDTLRSSTLQFHTSLLLRFHTSAPSPISPGDDLDLLRYQRSCLHRSIDRSSLLLRFRFMCLDFFFLTACDLHIRDLHSCCTQSLLPQVSRYFSLSLARMSPSCAQIRTIHYPKISHSEGLAPARVPS